MKVYINETSKEIATTLAISLKEYLNKSDTIPIDIILDAQSLYLVKAIFDLSDGHEEYMKMLQNVTFSLINGLLMTEETYHAKKALLETERLKIETFIG